MRFQVAVFYAGLILPFLAHASSVASDAVRLGPNLIKNASMEEDADNDGRPDAWRTSKDVAYRRPERLAGKPWLIERSQVCHSGKWSLHYASAVINRPPLTLSDWWDFAAWKKWSRAIPATWAIPVISNRFQVLGEREYLFRIWIKAKSVRILHVKYIGHFKGYPETKTFWTQPLLRAPNHRTHLDGSWDWEPFETRLFVPGGQDWGRLEVWLWQDGQPSEIWVDDAEARLILSDDEKSDASGKSGD